MVFYTAVQHHSAKTLTGGHTCPLTMMRVLFLLAAVFAGANAFGAYQMFLIFSSHPTEA